MPFSFHRKSVRPPLVTLSAVLFAAATSACASDEPAARSPNGITTVQVGVVPIVDVAPLYLGQEKGFYSKRGLKLDMVTAQGGAAVIPGVVSGQLEFGFSNVTSLMLAQSNGMAVEGVSSGSASTGEQGADYSAITVKGNSPIKTARNLEGKKVAVNTLKNIGDTSIRESVRKASGDPDKVRFVELPFDQMPAALDDGQIDAAWVSEPALAVVRAQGGRIIASNYVDVAEDLTVALYFTSASHAKENSEVVDKFREATAESHAYANTHPDEVRQVLTTYTEIPRATIERMTLPKWPNGVNRASVETLAELGQRDGLFSTAPDLDQLLP
ncbi:ABC transporter substrate-binding protein [Streptomyces sp. NPDC002838]|uniref:ABC transporter substrate-binding protein n=1 Tax=Streptomyces sp. NPDC002838 TaxID=3154436 RepID=UPI00332FED75